MNKTILLTGATGYLGERLGRQLLADNYSLIALHLNHNEDFTCDSKYKNEVKKIFLSDTSVNDIFKENEICGIIHTATLYGRSGESLSDLINANVVFPVELIFNAVKYNVKFFINTDTILNKYISPYALTKNNVTEWMKMYSDRIKMIDVKLDHFYGPNDKNTKFVAEMLEKLANNEHEINLTEGTQTRDFIYIDDVIEAYRIILKNIDKFAPGQIAIFEAGTNQKTSIRYLVKKLKALTGAETKLNFGAIPYRKNEMLDYDVNTTSLRLLGWEPKTDIDEGLKKIVQEMKINK